MRLKITAATLGLLMGASCASGDYTQLYATEPHAPSLAPDSIAALEHLGPTLVDDGANFGVYSEHATRVELLLFDDPESTRPNQRFPMERFGDVWNLYVEGVGRGQYYGYVAWGPNWTYDEQWYPGSVHGFHSDVDDAGNRFNPNKLLLDPYGKAVHRDHDWSRGNAASGPKRAESTWAAAAKSVIIDHDEFTWGEVERQWRTERADNTLPGHHWNDLVIYEVHPKGFTANPASDVEHPGTYRGIGEMASYLQDLGINAVELMPVHEKPPAGTYWGYWNTSYFAPENSYAWATRPQEITDEFKWMVQQLHQHDIEVVLDVVYNHSGEGGLWRDRVFVDDVLLDPEMQSDNWYLEPKEVATIMSYRGLDNAAYYALTEDNQEYWNNTGVGNQMRPNHAPMRRMIVDSLHYYAQEMHVDGFRFDIAGILGEQDLNYNYWDDPQNTVLQDIIDDPVLQEQHTRIIAEPWSAGGSYGALIGAYPSSTTDPDTGWAEWNGRFRDWWRSFINWDDYGLNQQEGDTDGGFTLTGSEDYYAWNGRKPYHAVNYVTSHDGFTMYDLVSYDQRVNGCGPLNPVCCDNPSSAWCEIDSGESNNRSRNWQNEAAKRQMMRNFFTAMMVSQGTPMLLGGDEWMRTQYGNNNAFSTGADNEWNWFRWGEWVASNDRERMHDFVRKVTRFRREHSYAFAPTEYGQVVPAWRNRFNQPMSEVDWAGRQLMIQYAGSASGPDLVIMINMDRNAADFSVPFGKWGRVLDTQSYFDTAAYFDESGADPSATANASPDEPVEVSGSVYTVSPSSIVVLEALQ